MCTECLDTRIGKYESSTDGIIRVEVESGTETNSVAGDWWGWGGAELGRARERRGPEMVLGSNDDATQREYFFAENFFRNRNSILAAGRRSHRKKFFRESFFFFL